MRVESVPEQTLRRLPRYFHMLEKLQEAGQAFVSASLLAEALDIHPTQVRKDLAMTGSQGRPKVGHRVDDLLAAIETFLSWDSRSDAFLVGAGSLGTALMGYPGFEKAGITIVAAFDAHPQKAGKMVHGVRIFPMSKFENLCTRMQVSIGILAVPEAAAQATADLMVCSGIQAIWNFSSTNLVVPPDLIVENVELYASLAILGRKLARRKRDAAALKA